MQSDKKFLTYDEQIERLEKTRKLKIVDRKKFLLYLKKYNYENFVNCYSKYLINKDTREFIEGVTSNTLISIFEYDRNISSILLPTILELERHITTTISYVIPKIWMNSIIGIKSGDILNLSHEDFQKIFPNTIDVDETGYNIKLTKDYLIRYVPKNVLHKNPSLWKISIYWSIGDIKNIYLALDNNAKEMIIKELIWNIK